ncbi:MAG: OmpA family protein [Kiloniellales bacterium]
MTGTGRTGDRKDRNRGRPSLRALPSCLAGLALLAGCSALPDWGDPSRWSAERSDALSQLSPETIAEAEADPESFPNLASVPDEAPRPLPRPQREQIAARLASDHAAAAHGGARSDAIPEDAPPAADIKPQPVPESTPPALYSSDASQPPDAPSDVTRSAQAVASSQGMQVDREIESGVVSAPKPATAAADGAQLIGVIYFGHGSSSLNAHDRDVLVDIAAIRRERGGTLRVIGHASAATGPVSEVDHSLANFETSQKRANVVAAELIRIGVPEGRVEAEARSDTQPVYHELMPTGEAANRRTEIFLE